MAVVEWFSSISDKKPISNFRPELLSVISTVTDQATDPETFVKLKIRFHDGQQSAEFIEPLSCIENIRWIDKDRRCRIHPAFPKSKANREFQDIILSKLPNVPEETFYCIIAT